MLVGGLRTSIKHNIVFSTHSVHFWHSSVTSINHRATALKRNWKMETTPEPSQPIQKRSVDIEADLNTEAKKAKSLNEVISRLILGDKKIS